jgi:4-amino-4-deoxy-L-arabinose transferase-like glycosyltransferase
MRQLSRYLQKRGAVVAFALSAAVDLLYLATASGPSFTDPLIDADYYDYLGVRLASGEGFEDGPFWQPPLYPLILGGLYRLLGHDLLWPRLLQALLGAGTAALGAAIGARTAESERAGLWAGVLIALHGSLVFYSGEILPVTLATFLGALAVYAATSEPLTARWAALAGAAVGCASLAVGAMMVLVVPLVAAALKKGRALGPVVAAGAVSLVLVATFANRWRSGEWVLISANLGVNLWIGNNPEGDRLEAVRPGATWMALVDEPTLQGIETAAGHDRYFLRKAARYCAQAPLDCAGGLLRKARLVLLSRELPRNENIYVVAAGSPVLRVLALEVGGLALPYLLLLPLAAAGAADSVRHRRAKARIVAGAGAALASVPVIFFVTGRYRAPMAPAVCVLAVLGARALWAGGGRALPQALAAIAVLALAAWPVRLSVDEVDFEAEMGFAAGGRRARLGDDLGAVVALERAVARRPDFIEARYNLGLALERLGRLESAEANYDAILRLLPGHAAASQRKREVLRRKGAPARTSSGPAEN